MRNYHALHAPFLLLLLLIYIIQSQASQLPNPKTPLKNSKLHQSYRFDPFSRTLFSVIEKCIPPEQNFILEISPVIRCPCFVSFGLSSQVASNVNVDFFVMRADDYRGWRGKSFQGLPSYEQDFSAINNKANTFSIVYDFFFAQAPNKELNEDADFIFVVRTSSSKDDCQLEIMTKFGKKPLPCPDRLPSANNRHAETIDQINNNSRQSYISTKNNHNISTLSKLQNLQLTTKENPSTNLRQEQITTILGPNSNLNNVVAGTPVTDTSIQSYMVAIRSSTGSCSGTVVAPNWILTAAHCRVRIGAITLVSGSTNNNGISHVVEAFIPHPNFQQKDALSLEKHDIALLKTKNVIENAKPVHLNTQKTAPSPDEYVRASGYGQIAEGWVSDSATRPLLQVDMPIVAFDRCLKAFVEWGASEFAKSLNGEGHLCVGFVDGGCGGDTCYGDSGGPIVIRNTKKKDRFVQVGIVSGGIGCARKGLPGVYTRIAAYYDWIRKTTNETVIGTNIEGEDDSINVEVEETVEKSKRGLNGKGNVSKAGLILTLVAVSIGVFLILLLVGRWIAKRVITKRRTKKNESNLENTTSTEGSGSREESMQFDKINDVNEEVADVDLRDESE